MMTDMEVDYEYKVRCEEVPHKSFVKVGREQNVKHLLQAIWEEEKRQFAVYEVFSMSALSLWKEGDVESLTFNRRLFGGDDSVFKVDEEKKVSVTPVGAKNWDQAFVVSAKDSSTAAGPAEALDRLVSFMDHLTVTVNGVANAVGLLMKIHRETWRENTSSHTADGGAFKKDLISAYGDSYEDHNLMCMVTGKRLPYKYVTAAHIVGKKSWAQCRVLLDIDVDDVHNGVLWCTPIEEAWTKNKLCFFWSVLENNFTVLVLDLSLQNTPVCEYGKALTVDARKTVSKFLGDVTFGQLHGKNMKFLNDCRPYKRCFSVMSVMKKQWALEEGSTPMFADGSYDLDYWSAGAYVDRVQTWLEERGADLKVPEAPSEEEEEAGSGRSDVG